jgi:hypothetical protein
MLRITGERLLVQVHCTVPNGISLGHKQGATTLATCTRIGRHLPLPCLQTPQRGISAALGQQLFMRA